jgi:hypothetical protein
VGRRWHQARAQIPLVLAALERKVAWWNHGHCRAANIAVEVTSANFAWLAHRIRQGHSWFEPGEECPRLLGRVDGYGIILPWADCPSQTAANPRTGLALRTNVSWRKSAATVCDEAWRYGVFHQYVCNRLYYYTLRKRFGMSLRCWAIEAMGGCLQAGPAPKRSFCPLVVLPTTADPALVCSRKGVSIWTVAGRQRIPFVAGGRQVALLSGFVARPTLSCVRQFYPHQVCVVRNRRLRVTDFSA